MSSVFSSWKNLRRTPYQSLTALFVVITTFFMVYLFSTFLYLGDQILYFFETRPQILVFFETKVSDSQASESAKLISQLDYVHEVKIIGKSEAFASYTEENKDESLLLELLTPELFPTSLSITANSTEGLDKIRAEIEKIDGVDDVDYRQDVVKEFLSWTNLIRTVGLIVCGLFTLQFVLVIMVITSMKVANRRRSINIMSILGAWRSTIKGAFVRESMWLGLIGSLIAFGLAQAVIWYFSPAMSSFLGEIKILPLEWTFLVLQLIAGSGVAILLAAISAWIAATRLIKR